MTRLVLRPQGGSFAECIISPSDKWVERERPTAVCILHIIDFNTTVEDACEGIHQSHIAYTFACNMLQEGRVNQSTPKSWDVLFNRAQPTYAAPVDPGVIVQVIHIQYHGRAHSRCF